MHRNTARRLLVIFALLIFIAGLSSEAFARRGGFSSSRSSISRSSSRSSSSSSFRRSSNKSHTRSSSSKRQTAKKPAAKKPAVQQSTTRSTPKPAVKPAAGQTTKPASSTVRPAAQRSSSKSPSTSNYMSRGNSFRRQSTASRQKAAAMSTAKKSTAVSTKGMTSSQVRNVKSQQRKYTRDLKSENRQLKRKLRSSERQTARARRDAREARYGVNPTVVYANPGYGLSNTLWTMTAIMAFNNMYHGIHFHDHYNHALSHSWLWHYNHPNYDRTHWSPERRAEYDQWNNYYQDQGVQPNPNYVDPGTNKDEDYIESYVEANPDEFYGAGAEEFTVDTLPDESVQPQLLTASASMAPQVQKRTVQHNVTVRKKTSAATWFILILGTLVLVGVVMVVMYNKGYF